MIPPYLADTRVAKLTFFPEGGNLIEGIPAKMAFKALNEKGIYGIKVFSKNNCHTIIIEFIYLYTSLLFYDSSCFQLSFIYHNHHGEKTINYYISAFYQIHDVSRS